MKNEFKGFIAICDWEFENLGNIPYDPCIWQAIAAKLLGLDK